MTRPDRIIPVEKIDEGLRLNDQNIRGLVESSQLLLSKDHDLHAISLAILGFEELGKFSELQTLQEAAKKTGDSSISVKDELFRSHPYKQRIAKRLMPEEATILVPAYFDKQYFDSKYFQTENITVEPEVRSECVFVDWIDNDWRVGIGTSCDRKRLQKLLESILQALDKLEER